MLESSKVHPELARFGGVFLRDSWTWVAKTTWLKEVSYPVNWYVGAFKKYAFFDGRATRAEYWFFQLFNTLVIMVLVVVGMLFEILGTAHVATAYNTGVNTTVLELVGPYLLASFLPNLAVSVRRLHDTGRTGWWLCVGFIPYVGLLAQIIFFVQDSQPGENGYGSNPKAQSAAQSIAE